MQVIYSSYHGKSKLLIILPVFKFALNTDYLYSLKLYLTIPRGCLAQCDTQESGIFFSEAAHFMESIMLPELTD